MVPNLCYRLIITVIVHCNGAAANINILPYLSVAHIAKMRNFAAITNLGILQFNEIADLTADAKLRAWTKVRVGTYSALVADDGFAVTECLTTARLPIIVSEISACGPMMQSSPITVLPRRTVPG